MQRSAFVATLALVLLLAETASAAQIESVHTNGSFETITVLVTLSGDDGDESLALEVRGPDDGAFREAHPFVRYEAHGLATTVFDLAPDAEHELRVTLEDPDGVTGEPSRTTTVRTRGTATPPTPARTLWVSASEGRDASDAGTSEDDPLASLQYALDRAMPGDEIRVMPGTYAPASAWELRATAEAPVVVRAHDMGDPPVIDASGSDHGLSLQHSSHVWVDGLRIENADDGGKGIYLRSSSHMVVRNCVLRDNGRWNILVSKSDLFPGGATEGGFHLIEDNVIESTADGDCSGASNSPCPDQVLYGIKQDNDPGAATVIRGNVIRGHVDNITLCGSESAARDLAPDADVLELTGSGTWTNWAAEAYDNVLEDARDDAIELDGICVAARVYRNEIVGAQNPISMAPVMPGPVFVVRNVVRGEWGEAGVKMNTAGNPDIPTRNVLLYHNTFVRQNAGPILNLWYAVAGDHDVPIRNVVFRNNVLATPEGGVCTNENEDGERDPDFDWNLWYTPDASGIFAWDDGSAERYDSLEAFREGTGQEDNGLFAPPMLDDELRPLEGSPVIDRGTPIPGVNDGYAGEAPDIGAFERGGGVEPGDRDGGMPAGDGGPGDGDGGGPGDGGIEVHDGATAGDGGIDRGDGCSCRAASPGDRSAWPLLLLVAALGLWSRRRTST